MSPLWKICTPPMDIVCKVPLTRRNEADEDEAVQQNGTATPSSIPVSLWKFCEEGRLDEVREALANIGVNVNSRSEDNTMLSLFIFWEGNLLSLRWCCATSMFTLIFHFHFLLFR